MRKRGRRAITRFLGLDVELSRNPTAASHLMSAVSYRRDVAQPGRALAWGARGRQFKSARPDHLLLPHRQCPYLLSAGELPTASAPKSTHRKAMRQKNSARGRLCCGSNLPVPTIYSFHIDNARTFSPLENYRPRAPQNQRIAKRCAKKNSARGRLGEIPRYARDFGSRLPLRSRLLNASICPSRPSTPSTSTMPAPSLRWRTADRERPKVNASQSDAPEKFGEGSVGRDPSLRSGFRQQASA